MTTFALQVSKFIEKTKANADLVTKKIVIDVGASIVAMSPVGDGTLWKNPPPKGYVGGRFRANWQLGINVTRSGELPDIDPTGDASNSRIMAAIPENAAGNIFFLTNNLPYAQKLEDGWSGQAPNGMVMLTVIKWNNIVENAVNGVKQGGGDMEAGIKAYPL
ncbi:MAG: hypothetical protein ABI351_14205 [Herbaspirillum sp.]